MSTDRQDESTISGRSAVPEVVKLQVEGWHAKAMDTLEAFRAEMHRQIDSIVARERIALVVPVQSRVKSLESILRNIDREPELAKTYAALHDLCGIRLILLFRTDIDRATEALKKYFGEIDIRRKQVREDQLGYTSTHCIVSVPSSWNSIPTMARFSGLVAEIQVRTVSQHTWAAASHELQCKEASVMPETVRRAMYRLAAVLEIVDDEIERVRNERRNYLAAIQSSGISPDMELDVDSLAHLLEELLPTPNHWSCNDDDSEDLLLDLREYGYHTAKDVRELWSRFEDQILMEDRTRAARVLKGEELDAPKEGLDRYQAGAFYTFGGLIRTAIEYNHASKKLRFPVRKPPVFDMLGQRLK